MLQAKPVAATWVQHQLRKIQALLDKLSVRRKKRGHKLWT